MSDDWMNEYNYTTLSAAINNWQVTDCYIRYGVLELHEFWKIQD